LEELCPTVYFQAPPGNEMQFPCILYMRDAGHTEFAGNNPYRFSQRYQVTVIDEDPDSPIPGEVAKLPTCIYDRFYVADNLNHDVFNLYFEENTA